jgi:hypothetical protein
LASLSVAILVVLSGISHSHLTRADSLPALTDAAADVDTAPPHRIAQLPRYSASGTHQCRGPGGETQSCVVTGVAFSNCIDASSALQSQDCCLSTRICSREGNETKCQPAGKSAAFTMQYCIPSRGF